MNLKNALSNDEAKSAFLSCTRQEMYQALSLFHSHVVYTLSVMFTLLTAVLAIFGFSGNALQNFGATQGIVKWIGGVILVLIFPLGAVSIIIIGRYYKLYVAALIFSAEAHESEGIANHAWFEDLDKYRKSLGENHSKAQLVRSRTYAWPHSWILYSILIGLISLAGLILGILLLAI